MTNEEDIIKLAHESGFEHYLKDKNSIIVRHSNGSWIDVTGSVFRFAKALIKDNEPVAELKKQVEELKTRLNQNVSLLVNETLQYENEILLKQVADLKESLLFALQELNGEVSHNHQDYIQKYHLARERAK